MTSIHSMDTTKVTTGNFFSWNDILEKKRSYVNIIFLASVPSFRSITGILPVAPLFEVSQASCLLPVDFRIILNVLPYSF
jgi:hypothetical protein